MMIKNKKFSLECDSSGKVKSLKRFGDGKELLDTANPGRGFFLRGMNYVHASAADIPLSDLSFDGDRLIARSGTARLTFDVNVQDSYVAFSLERVEGVPTANAMLLQFEINVVDGIAMHPLDHMTYRRNCYGATDGIRYDEAAQDQPINRRVTWSWLWDRNPDNPFGAFALQCPRDNEEHDETLLDIWVNEEALPKPLIEDAWTVARAREWLDGWLEFSRDIRSITIDGKNAAELRELVDFAERENLNQIKLFTHTWRGGFWPYDRHHLTPHPEVFPGGKVEFKAFCDYVAGKNMRLELHTISMCISNVDPYWVITPDGPDPRLAHWVKGELVEAIDDDPSILLFRPEPGGELPPLSGYGPKSLLGCFTIDKISVGREFFSVGEFLDTDKDVWRLKISERGLYGSEETDHARGEKIVGYIRTYDQAFTSDNNSTLLEELAKGYGDFSNENHVTMMSLDGLEVHAQDGYGEPKFGRLLYKTLDHYTTSGSSTGGVMPFHMEYWFCAARQQTDGCTTMPLALERSGRRATNPYEVHVEVAKFVAKGCSVGGLMKPEPMFDLSREMLDTHGLSRRFVEQLRLWRRVADELSDDQRQVILDSYRKMDRPLLGVDGGNHHESDVLFEPQLVNAQLQLQPLRLLSGPGIDAGWGTGQEFGPICVWQFVRVGEKVRVGNAYDSQEPQVVIHVMPALTDHAFAAEAAVGGKADEDAEGYDIGAGQERSLTTDGPATDLVLQPKVEQIKNWGDHAFEATQEGLELSYHNNLATPYTDRENLPCWEVKANSNRARGLGLTVTGDGSGALLLVQLRGSGQADYILPIDFTGTKEVMIPSGIASWTDQRWFYSMGVKRMLHEEPVVQVGLSFGHVPPETHARVEISNLRLLAESPASLVNPTLKINGGLLQIKGDVEADHYIWYTGEDTVGVYDLNWNAVERLPVQKQDFVVPGKGTDIEYQVLSEGDDLHPQLGVQIFTVGDPMRVGAQ